MMAAIRRVDFFRVQISRKLIKMKHRIILTMFTIKRNIFAEIHILHSVGNKTTIASLHPHPEFGDFILNIAYIAVSHYRKYVSTSCVACNFAKNRFQ